MGSLGRVWIAEFKPTEDSGEYCEGVENPQDPWILSLLRRRLKSGARDEA